MSCCSPPSPHRRRGLTVGRLFLILAAVIALVAALGGCSTSSTRRADVESDLSSRIGAEAHLGRTWSESTQTFDPQWLDEDLTEDRAVQIALLNNPRVAALYETLGIARAELLQAGLLKNPVFSGNAKFFGEGTEIELGLAQSFLDVFLMPLRRRVAETAFEARRAEVTRDLVRLAFDVRRQFVEIRAAQQVTEMRRRAVEAADAGKELMRRLHDAGNVIDRERTLEESSAATARLALADAEAHEHEAREPLNTLLGLWGRKTAWRISGHLGEDPAVSFDIEALESRAVRISLDLARSRSLVDEAAQQAGVRSWETVFPSADAGVAVKQEAVGGWGFGPSLEVAIPLFDLGTAKSAAAAAALQHALADYAATAIEVRTAARTLRERSLALRDRAVYLRSVVIPLRGRLTHETLQFFNAMQIGVFDVLMARREELDAGRDYVESLRDAWRARLDLSELLAGSLNHERLGSPSQDHSKLSESDMTEGRYHDR